MITRTWVARLVAVGGVVVALGLPGAAGAQTAPDYPGGPPPQVQGESLGREVPTEVLGESQGRQVPTEVRGESVSRGGQPLPVTGADVAGLVALGLGSIAAGAVLVRRGRARVRPA